MSKLRSYTFVVEGYGTFPFDMLRYDSCWPLTESDALKLHWVPGDGNGHRSIALTTLHEPRWEPTEGRWSSFTWKVVAQA